MTDEEKKIKEAKKYFESHKNAYLVMLEALKKALLEETDEYYKKELKLHMDVAKNWIEHYDAMLDDREEQEI